MTEELDDLMRRHLPSLEAKVHAAIDNAKVGDYIPFEKLTTSLPWTVTDEGWAPENSPSDKCTIMRANPVCDGAYEISTSAHLSINELQQADISTVVSKADRAAKNLVEGFFAKVFELVQRGAKSEKYSSEAIAGLAIESPGLWRLIGLPGEVDPVLAEVKKRGISDTIQLPTGSSWLNLPLLISTQAGPKVSQLDSPVLTWRRTNGSAELRMKRRFLFTQSWAGASTYLLGPVP